MHNMQIKRTKRRGKHMIKRVKLKIFRHKHTKVYIIITEKNTKY